MGFLLLLVFINLGKRNQNALFNFGVLTKPLPTTGTGNGRKGRSTVGEGVGSPQRQRRAREGDSRAPAPTPKVSHHPKGQAAKDLAKSTTH